MWLSMEMMLHCEYRSRLLMIFVIYRGSININAQGSSNLNISIGFVKLCGKNVPWYEFFVDSKY